MALSAMQTDTNLKNGTQAPREWQEYEIPVPWGIVAGKWWGSRAQQPVLSLHGWQDNCGTFDRLIPLLPADISILAIDLPGHGKSSPYPKGMQYYLFWDGIALIRRIVKHHKWTNITLIGHSLGGALSFMYAASFPNDVAKYISIDIAGPTIRDHEKLASSTGDCIDKSLLYETLPESKMPCYDYDEMIQLVLQAYGGSVDLESCKVLMKRGMAPAPASLSANGFHFSRDLRLKVSMLGMFSEEQLMFYAKQVKCQVLNIRGRPGMDFGDPNVYPKIMDILRANCKRLVYEEVEGTHHLHLVTPERIHKIVTDFLRAK
ncbi:unnamed protein product [Diamesa serratosioi]